MATYTNYRWVSAHARKGDRYLYKRDIRWSALQERPQEQVIVAVTYDSDSRSPHWGKWHVHFGSQSPALHRLSKQEIPKFSSKQDAIDWATAMIALEGLS